MWVVCLGDGMEKLFYGFVVSLEVRERGVSEDRFCSVIFFNLGIKVILIDVKYK